MPDLNEFDQILERMYFSGELPMSVRAQVWYLHGELRQHGLVDRPWTVPVEEVA